MATPEGKFKRELIEDLKKNFPGCMVLRQDPQQHQGIPDILVLYGDRWAALETKAEPKSVRRPNQPQKVEMMNSMSYAAFVNPSNKGEVLNDLQRALRTKG